MFIIVGAGFARPNGFSFANRWLDMPTFDSVRSIYWADKPCPYGEPTVSKAKTFITLPQSS